VAMHFYAKSLSAGPAAPLCGGAACLLRPVHTTLATPSQRIRTG
jgi:hypothetical protein